MAIPKSWLTILATGALVAYPLQADEPTGLSATSREAAEHAVAAYGEAAIATLADLVRFRSVHVEGTENATSPEFRAMTEYLSGKAAELGLDFSDHGSVGR